MASTYCDQTDIEDIFGSDAVDKWLTVDATDGSSEKAARLARAIAYAGDRIDDVLRTTSYKVPAATSSAATPTTIENLAASLAGLWMFSIRGHQDIEMREGLPIHRYYFLEKQVNEQLELIRTGKVKLDAVTG